MLSKDIPLKDIDPLFRPYIIHRIKDKRKISYLLLKSYLYIKHKESL